VGTEAKRADLTAVQRVADAASLTSVTVVALHAEIAVPPESVTGRGHQFAYETRSEAKPIGEKTAEVLVTLDLPIKRKEEKEPWAALSATLRLIYEFKPSVPAEGDLAQFAQINAVYNAWPYLRELMQAMTVRMGVPPLTLPLYKIKPRVRLPAKAPTK
jgi:hypothetical protein